MDEHFPGPSNLTMPQRILNFAKSYTEALPWVEDKELTALSTAYVIMERLGYNAEDEIGLELMLHDWENVNVEKTLATVNDASKMELSQIGDYIRKEERKNEAKRVNGNGTGISGNSGTLGAGGQGQRRTDEGTGRIRPVDGEGKGNAKGAEPNPGAVVRDLGEVHGGGETGTVDIPSAEREDTANDGAGRQGVQPEVRADEAGTEAEERTEPHIPAEGLHGVHEGDNGDGERNNEPSDAATDGTGVTEKSSTQITVTKASLHPVRTPNGGVAWVPEDVTEQEVTIDDAGKVAEESEPASVTVDAQEKEDVAATEEEVDIGYPRPTHAEREIASKLWAGRVPKGKYLEYSIAALHVEFYRWHQIKEYGGGMYETDGQAMNLVRNHIIATLKNLENRGLDLPETENTPIPREAPNNYMKLGTKDYGHRLKFFTKSTIENLIHELPADFLEEEKETLPEDDLSQEDEPIAVEEEEKSPDMENEQELEKPFTTEDFSHLDFTADMSTTSGKRKVFERNMAAIRTVKRLEDEEREAFATNAEGTRNIAKICRDVNAKLIYISTDYVFPGDGEYFYETPDRKDPQNVYGKSKLAGEYAVIETLVEYFIVRISWVFGINGKNFVRTMLNLSETHDELKVVADQIGSPTYTVDLARLLVKMAESDCYGIYHATNEGICSWAEFAEEIFRQSGKATRVVPVPSSAYPTKAKRPLNSRLSKNSLDAAGFSRLPHWKDALGRYLIELSAGPAKEL